jgi:adenylylsulfate kinase
MSWAVWITGLPGSGKTAIARAVEAELHRQRVGVQVLELDALRRVLTPTPTYDHMEREAVYRALVFIATTLTCAGRPVVIDATAHRRAWRDLARRSIPRFAEVQLVCPVDVARARERTRPPGAHPPAVYAHAGRPGATVPGVDVPYEHATAPELTIDTTRETVQGAATLIATYTGRFGPCVAPAALTTGWTLWVTGRPGSGKTTLVAGLCERASSRGVAITVVDPGEAMSVIAQGSCTSARDREIVTRAIVLAAKVLNQTGAAVIIDGPAPAASGSRLARELLAPFAQVELMCSPELGRARERGARWGIVPCPTTSGSGATPDLALDYAPAVTPDLTVNTEALASWTAADVVFGVVERLDTEARRISIPVTD